VELSVPAAGQTLRWDAYRDQAPARDLVQCQHQVAVAVAVLKAMQALIQIQEPTFAAVAAVVEVRIRRLVALREAPELMPEDHPLIRLETLLAEVRVHLQLELLQTALWVVAVLKELLRI
jgi:hypothetical protein